MTIFNSSPACKKGVLLQPLAKIHLIFSNSANRDKTQHYSDLSHAMLRIIHKITILKAIHNAYYLHHYHPLAANHP